MQASSNNVLESDSWNSDGCQQKLVQNNEGNIFPKNINEVVGTETLKNNKNAELKNQAVKIIDESIDGSNHLLAKALFDNVADSPEELAFRKGDVLTVIEHEHGNMDGWWLCSLRGRQGICPKNRLKLILPNYETCEISLNGKLEFGAPKIITEQNIKCLPKWKSTSQDETSHKNGDVYLYDTPPSGGSTLIGLKQKTENSVNVNINDYSKDQTDSTVHLITDYDIPVKCKDRHNSSFNTSKVFEDNKYDQNDCEDLDNISKSLEFYDTPRSLQYLISSNSFDSLPGEDSINGSVRTSTIMADYDTPRPLTANLSFQDIFDQKLEQKNREAFAFKEDNFNFQKSLQDLHKCQNEVLKAASALIEFVKSPQKDSQMREIHFVEIKFSLEKLKSGIRSLILIKKEILNNIGLYSNAILKMKLSTSVNVLVETNTYIETVIRTENIESWSMLRPHDQYNFQDSLITIVQNLIENIQETMTYILESVDNSIIQSVSLQLSDSCKISDSDSSMKYEYVNTQDDKVSIDTDKNNKNNLSNNSGKLKEKNEMNLPNNLLGNLDDKNVLKFYAATTIMSSSNLTRAIDYFLRSIEHNQPPKIFLANSKLVVLTAFRLLYMGNIISRSISNTNMRLRLHEYCNLLNESLTSMNLKTKQAALFFPSVPAVQDMVDSVVDMSYFARKLKALSIHCCQ